jgi:PilZ domain
VVLLAHLESSGAQPDRRRSGRHLLKLRVPGSTPSQSAAVVLIHDLSQTGLLIETDGSLEVGSDLEIDLPETGVRQARVVWNGGHYFGCQFHAPISRGGLSAALLKSPAELHSVNEVYDDVWGDEDKFPLRTRAGIILGLSLASWAVILAVFTIL